MARKRRGTSGLGRKPAKGKGKFCVTTRRGTGKKATMSTTCYTSEAKAVEEALKKKPSGGYKSVLLYRRARA